MGVLKAKSRLPVKSPFLAIGVFVLVALIGGLVGAQVSAHLGGNSNVVHLCINNSSGAIEAIGASESCKNNWSPLDIQSLPPPVMANGAAIDAMVHPMSPGLAKKLTGDPGLASGAEDVLARLDEANVQKAVMQALGFFRAIVTDDAGVRVENDFVAAESTTSDPLDRLIGFCGINPLFAEALMEIDRCFDELGMVGIKLNPPFSRMDLKDPAHAAALDAVFDKAKGLEDRGLDAPVQLHMRSPRDPALKREAFENLAEIINNYPDVRVSHSHCGGVLDEHVSDQWLTRLRPNPDTAFLDLSICLNHFEDAPFSKRELIVWRLRKWGIERLLWSSDYVRINPAQQTPLEALETLEKYPFTQAEVDTILSGDAASLWLEGP